MRLSRVNIGEGSKAANPAGYGVQQDYVQAHMWYNLSAAQGWGAAAEARTMLERAMTPAQIAEAQKLAREWKPKPER